MARLGGDFDRFSWAPGDGSDSVDGGASRDSLFFRGTDAPEAFGVQAAGRRVRFTRDADGVALELSDLEEIDTLAGGGADTVAIDDLTGTPVELVDVSLANAFSAPGGDGQPDRVAVTGTARDDRLTLTGRVVVAGTATLTGLGARVNVSHAEAGRHARDRHPRRERHGRHVRLRPGHDRARSRLIAIRGSRAVWRRASRGRRRGRDTPLKEDPR